MFFNLLLVCSASIFFLGLVAIVLQRRQTQTKTSNDELAGAPNSQKTGWGYKILVGVWGVFSLIFLIVLVAFLLNRNARSNSTTLDDIPYPNNGIEPTSYQEGYLDEIESMINIVVSDFAVGNAQLTRIGIDSREYQGTPSGLITFFDNSLGDEWVLADDDVPGRTAFFGYEEQLVMFLAIDERNKREGLMLLIHEGKHLDGSHTILTRILYDVKIADE